MELIFKPDKTTFLSFLEKRCLNFDINYNEVEFFLEELFVNLKDKFKHIPNKYYSDGNDIILHTAHYSQSCLILLELNNIIYNSYLKNKNEKLLEICDKIYFMNTTQSSCDLYYDIDFPKKIFCDHPLGSVIGRAKFSEKSSLVFGGKCNIGQNRFVYPEIDGDLVMYSGSVLLGKTTVKGLVVLSYGSYVKDEGLLENVLIFGQSPNLIIKKLKPDDFIKYCFFRSSETFSSETFINLCKDYVESPLSKKIHIEPFFDDKRIIKKSSNVTIEKGKDFVFEKKIPVVDLTGYCSIHKMNNTFLLAYRIERNAHDISFYGMTSADGLSFQSEEHFTIANKNRDNHDPYLLVQEVDDKKEVGVFRGRVYRNSQKTGYHMNTGLHYFKFTDNTFDFTSNPNSLLVTGEHTKPWPGTAGDQFDSLNTINYHEGLYYTHVRANSVDRFRSPDDLYNGCRRNRGVQLVVFDKSRKRVCTGKNICRYWDSYEDDRKKEIVYKDVYIGNVMKYENTEYNLSIPSIMGFVGKKVVSGKPEVVKLFNLDGIYFTHKNSQLDFYRTRTTDAMFPAGHVPSKEESCMSVCGMVESNDHTRYFMYLLHYDVLLNVNGRRIDCYSIEKDRFNCVSCMGDTEGSVEIRPPTGYETICLNFETFHDGYIFCQVLSSDGSVISTSNKYSGNHIEQVVTFDTSVSDISNYTLRVCLFKAKLFSYKFDE